MASFANLLNNLSNELNETYVNQYKFAYVDKNVDQRLFYTYNARAEPAVYLLDPKTEMAYFMDNDLNKTEPGVLKNWILSGDYKKSAHSFKAPPLMNLGAFGRQKWYANFEVLYMATFGGIINAKLASLGAVAKTFPLNLIFTRNYMSEDPFGYTLWRQIKLFSVIILTIGWAMLTGFRMVCCRKYKYVKKSNKVK